MKKSSIYFLMFLLGSMSAILFARDLFTGVSFANARAGHPKTRIASGFSLRQLARGKDPLENPSGVITSYGNLNDFPPQTVEASRTEPDENTYLVLDHNPGGPTAGFDYGRHFLFQGHELFSGDKAYVTRINLDITDPGHRITLLTPVGKDGKTHLNDIDGSTFDPFSKTLLFTQENGTGGGVFEINVNYSPHVKRLYGQIGRAGYEGIHPDDRGNLLIIEDTGGKSVPVDPNNPSSPVAARNPNSFVYRYLPDNPQNLSAGGKLQALQVIISGKAVKFVNVDADHPNGDVFSENQLKLHTLGTTYQVRWVTVHDTSADGTDEFDANAAAKSAGATPFKRPENAQFLPGSNFQTFFFAATGDTSADSGNQPALAARGAWGSIFRVDLTSDRNSGTISIVFLGDKNHASFDNVAFADSHTLLVSEDRGDGLHSSLDMLDSIWSIDFAPAKPVATRLIALGRDPASEKDVRLAGRPGFQNEGDNEPTGIHVSTGDASVDGMQGQPLDTEHARIFFTQQHGLNRTFEIVRVQ
jgi:hypothetical protein